MTDHLAAAIAWASYTAARTKPSGSPATQTKQDPSQVGRSVSHGKTQGATLGDVPANQSRSEQRASEADSLESRKRAKVLGPSRMAAGLPHVVLDQLRGRLYEIVRLSLDVFELLDDSGVFIRFPTTVDGGGREAKPRRRDDSGGDQVSLTQLCIASKPRARSRSPGSACFHFGTQPRITQRHLAAPAVRWNSGKSFYWMLLGDAGCRIQRIENPQVLRHL